MYPCCSTDRQNSLLWHTSHVFEVSSLVRNWRELALADIYSWALLQSCPLQSRTLRPIILALLSSKKKNYIKETWPRESSADKLVRRVLSWQFMQAPVLPVHGAKDADRPGSARKIKLILGKMHSLVLKWNILCRSRTETSKRTRVK